jgi:hypothetical protein
MRRIVPAALAAMFLHSTAQAQDATPDADRWRVDLTPYVWLPSLSGTVQPRAGLPTFKANLSTEDILDNLGGAFFLTGTARRGRLVLFADFTWEELARRETVTPPVLPITASVRGQISKIAATVAAGVTAVERPDATLDLLAGVRVWRVDASVDADVEVGGLLELGASGSRRVSWADPIVAARLRLQLTPELSVVAYGDIGGLNVNSRLTWQAVGTLNYAFSERFLISAGYRHMAVDYRRDGTVLDFALSGPLVGVTFRF